MAIVTQRLKDVLTSNGGDYTFINGEVVLSEPEHIGLAHYPIFRADYRERLNSLIFMRYMNEEIGLETDSMFRLAVMSRLNETMPVMNQLYRSVEMKYDPLSTVDIKTLSRSTSDETVTSSGTATQNAVSSAGTRAINSDYPQTMLASNKDYATSGADSTATTENSGDSSQTGDSQNQNKAENESQTTGYQGHTVALIEAYRNSLINVDLMVIDSLADCFFQLWGTPETYTNRGTFNEYYSPVR